LNLLLPALLTAAPQLTEKGHKAPAVEQKLHGEWFGNGDCQGDIHVAADGCFTWQHYGPGDASLAGTWSMKWDALPPTLRFACIHSTDPDYIGRVWEVKVVELDEATLAVKRSPDAGLSRFSRTKK
jgi:hypothetical protein